MPLVIKSCKKCKKYFTKTYSMLYFYTMETSNLRNNLRKYRKLAGGLTQQELAERTHVTRQSIISVEQGRYRPSVELALQLARVLGVKVEDLFELANEEENK